MTANFDADQYDEVAQYAAGAFGVVALAGMAYTGLIAAPEAVTYILGILGALGAYESGKRGERKKNDSPNTADLVDTILGAVEAVAGTEPTVASPDEKARVSDTSESDPRDDIAIEDTGTGHIPERVKRNTADSQTSPPPAAEQNFPNSVTSEGRSQQGTPAAHDAAEAEKTQSTTESTPLTDVQGIGPKRKARFTGTAIQTAENLAAADADSVAMSTGLSATRARTLIRRARELTRDE